MVRLQGVGKSEVYGLITRSHLSFQGNKVLNELYTEFRQTLIDQSPVSDLIGIEILHFQQSAEGAVAELSDKLQKLQEYLVFEVDCYGRITKVVNYSDLLNRWKFIREEITTTFGYSKELATFVNDFEQTLQLDEPYFRKQLENKGLYGALFSGIHGFDSNMKAFTRNKIISDFVGRIALPLSLTCEVSNIWSNYTNYWQLTCNGHLDATVFQYDIFKRLFNDVTNTFNFDAQPQVILEETYLYRQSDGWLEESKQYLSFEVPDVYHQEIEYFITLQANISTC